MLFTLALLKILLLTHTPSKSSAHRRLLSPHAAPNPAQPGLCAASVLVHGYKCQEFEVETGDGFLLSLQRIPEGRVGGGGGRSRPPVFVQHGILVDGMTWFLNPPDRNLPLILADRGFDVWIANTRGTRFSRRHRNLNPSQREYWNWSWDEIVAYDLPAAFEFVHRQTGQKMDYIGHSLGTLVALASISEGKLVDKLKSIALLSPVAYLSYMKTPLGVIAADAFVGEMIQLLGFSEFNPKGKAVAKLLKILCASPGVDCYDLLSAITGKNCCMNSSTVEVFLKYEPQPTSVKNMVHLAQTVRRRAVSKFDYGTRARNVRHYGQARPPVYNLSSIPRDLPIFIAYGGRDSLSDDRDVETLLDSLRLHDGDKLTVLFVKEYAHADFIMGVNARDVVYNALISFFNRW
uniref:Lipase n=1 Tax=Kalanchoe fedtschenkoi TaxID=63787 RepID=A0A7N0UCQ8_KALFE